MTAIDKGLAIRATEVLRRALEQRPGAERNALMDEAMRLHHQALGKRPLETSTFLDSDSPEERSPIARLQDAGRVEADLEIVARMAHEMLRAWCELNGDRSLRRWEDAPAWQRDSTRDTVRFFSDHPGADDGAMHEAWLDQKRRAGWTLGPVKDAERKRHPCMVPFDQLPAEQQFKDRLLRMVIGFGLSNARKTAN